MITSIRYSIDGAPPTELPNPSEGRHTIPIPNDRDGYVTIEIWVTDLAGNVAHEAYWLLMSHGIIKCALFLNDKPRYRLSASERIRYRTDICPQGFALTVDDGRGYGLYPIRCGYALEKLPDQLMGGC